MADTAADRLNDLVDAAWAAAAFAHLVRSGAMTTDGASPASAEDGIAMDALVAAGVDVGQLAGDEALTVRFEAVMASFRQLVLAIGITEPATEGEGWAAQDDETLLAQGRSSAFGGTMLARFAVPSLVGLAERFASPEGGVFLDVGVGVGELSAAFCDGLPTARVVGLDVMPRVLELARRTVAERGLTDRVELRQLGVQDLDDVAAFDLAWLPAPFIPEPVFVPALTALHRALRPGGWLVVGAGRFDGPPLSVAVTRWRTLIGGGTPLPADAARAAMDAAGFTEFLAIPTPPGAPALYAGRRPF
jgi:SAM-dependent methyltransferase